MVGHRSQNDPKKRYKDILKASRTSTYPLNHGERLHTNRQSGAALSVNESDNFEAKRICAGERESTNSWKPELVHHHPKGLCQSFLAQYATDSSELRLV